VDTQRASDAALDDLMKHGGYSALIVRSANTVRESTITPGLRVIGRAGAGKKFSPYTELLAGIICIVAKTCAVHPDTACRC
jgi:hypothetical protein